MKRKTIFRNQITITLLSAQRLKLPNLTTPVKPKARTAFPQEGGSQSLPSSNRLITLLDPTVCGPVAHGFPRYAEVLCRSASFQAPFPGIPCGALRPPIPNPHFHASSSRFSFFFLLCFSAPISAMYPTNREICLIAPGLSLF